MSDTVQQIKDKLSILDVVQPYVKLTHAGKYWRGLSPFNKEKTPSFFVSPERGLYHCFSSGKGGDMFTFVQEMENVDFKGALKILAEKAGVPLTYERPEARDERERLYAAMDAAKDFFKAELAKRKDALNYLEKRGISTESMEEWNLGYAPHEWQALLTHLIQLGFNDSELERAGLIKKSEMQNAQPVTPEKNSDIASSPPASDFGRAGPSRGARFYDRFRGRIMFPISDVSGRVIAFSGRIFEDDAKNPQAKYLNSPETPLFDKSKALFGIEKAKEGIRALNAVILVEGQLDLLMAHQAGYRNAVATSGTAFTTEHAKILSRYTPNLLIAYDGDRAGISAAGRAASIALPSGMNVKITKLPPEKDPADVILENLPAFKEAVKGALHVVDFYLAHIMDAKYDARTFRLEVTRVVLPYIAMIPNRVDQAHFIQRVADTLQVSEEAIIAELKKVQNAQPITRNETSESGAPRSTPHAAGSEPFLSRGDTIERLVWGLMLLFEERGEKAEAEQAQRALKQSSSAAHYERLQAGGSDDKRASLFEADLFLERNPEEKRGKALEDVYGELKREAVHEMYREVLRELKAAEAAHDYVKTESLMQNLQTLASSLR